MSAPELPAGIQAIEGNEKVLAELIATLQSRYRIIPFVGAGMSMPFGFPSWDEFLLRAGERAHIKEKIQQRLAAAEYEDAAEDIPPPILAAAIHETYGLHPLPDIITGPLCSLPFLTPGPVITTNYDHLLEKVFAQSGRPFAHVIWEKTLAEQIMADFSKSFQTLVKIHGDAWNATDRILTRAEYKMHYGDLEGNGYGFKEALPCLLHEMLMKSPLLFLGCSLSHDRTMQVLATVTQNFHGIQNFAILEKPASDQKWQERRKFLDDHHIRPLWYPTGAHPLLGLILAYLVEAAPDVMPYRPVRSAIPHDPALFFTGRAAELAALDAAFPKDTPGEQVITGLGGTGKTNLATQYSYRHQADYSVTLWIMAETRAGIETGLADAARILGLPERDAQDSRQAVSAVQAWLADHTDYLLVLDGVTDFGDVRDALPGGARGHLLLTTRLRDTQPPGRETAVEKAPVELRELPPEDAVDLLLRRSGRDTALDQSRREAAALADALGRLPLALVQAGAYLRNQDWTTLPDYLADFQKRKLAVFGVGEDDGYTPNDRTEEEKIRANVVTTWVKNFEAIRSDAAASGLLSLSAFLSPDAVPDEIVQGYFKTPAGGERALDLLARYSLISLNPTRRTYDINRMVQEAIKDRLKPETRKGYALQAVDLLARVFPPPARSNWPLCDRLLSHALALKDAVAEYGLHSPATWKLLYNLSVYLSERARHATAAPVLGLAFQQPAPSPLDAATLEKYKEEAKRAKELADKLAGSNRNDPVELDDLANIYLDQGNYTDAEMLYQQALAIREKVLGPEHPDTATSLGNLANLYHSQGNYADALPLYQRALAIREKVLGPEHPDTAIGLGNLAGLYHSQGNHTDALPPYQRALAIHEKVLGPEHPDTATSLNNLASLYDSQGNYADALPLLQRALLIQGKALGLDHPTTARSLNNLANLYHSQGNHVDALPLLQRALLIHEKVLGPEHPDTAIGLSNLASLYKSQGNHTDALPLYQRALAIQGKALGPEHPDTARSLGNLASLYKSQGNYADALPLYQRALAIQGKALGPEHPDTATSLSNLALLYKSQGNYADALPLLQRALAIREKALGLDHPTTATSLNNLATTLRALGREEEAQAHEARAQEIRARHAAQNLTP